VVVSLLLLGGTAAAESAEQTDDPDPDTDPDVIGDPEEPVDVDQPPITAGGLFTRATYPVSELQRPLTMTKGLTQVRASIGADVSSRTAFDEGGLSLDGRYGLHDNFTLLGGFQSEYNLKGFTLYAGFEGALAYDLVDIRVAARLGRSAVVAETDPVTGSPTKFGKGAGIQASIELGFPFRYAMTPQIAIVALETLIKLDLNTVQRSDRALAANSIESCFGVPGAGQMLDLENCVENKATPDLAPSLGIATNPIPQLSLVVFGQLLIRDFDTTGQLALPATARVQFSPNRRLDLGLELKFLNLRPVDPDGPGMQVAPGPFDQRFLNVFVQARY
jgi:hypothetical protein